MYSTGSYSDKYEIDYTELKESFLIAADSLRDFINLNYFNYKLPMGCRHILNVT